MARRTLDPIFFRPDVRGRARVGKVLRGGRAETYPGFFDDLLVACARVLACSRDGELYFLGRSLESVFDHLCGVLQGTSWANRPRLVPGSLWDWEEQRGDRAELAFRAHLERLGLSPRRILAAKRPVVLVDLVLSGGTFTALVELLERWCEADGIDFTTLIPRLGFVCLLSDERDARWREERGWPARFPPENIVDLVVPSGFWFYLGNWQTKTTPSYTPDLWGEPEAARPDHSRARRRAVRLAFDLFVLGCSRGRRRALAKRLVGEDAIRERWLRRLVRELHD